MERHSHLRRYLDRGHVPGGSGVRPGVRHIYGTPGFPLYKPWDIVVFFFWGSVLSIPLSLAAKALPNALCSLGRLPRWGARLGYLFLDTLATALGLAVVDIFLDSVSVPDPALVLAGVLLALPGLKDVGRATR